MKAFRAISCLLLAAAPVLAETPGIDDSPWLKPRSLQDFRALLDRSPFSLPTAEEAMEMEDRYFLTGAATIDDKPVVFVFDKNTQGRLMLEKFDTPGDSGRDRLIEFTPSIDPKNLTAKVQIEGKVSQIRFADSAFESAGGSPMAGQPPPGFSAPPGQPQPFNTPQGGPPMSMNQGYKPQLPQQPPQPQAPMTPGQPNQGFVNAPQNSGAVQPGQPQNSEPPRRVIRRRVISNPQPGQ